MKGFSELPVWDAELIADMFGRIFKSIPNDPGHAMGL
jgi:hypothetical protein